MFRKVQQHVEMMVEMFKRSKFYLSVATRMNYDEGFIFSESNIVSFLAELEEYICSLITYTAFKRDDPQAAISAIPLEKLFAKDFQRKDITVSFYSNFDQSRSRCRATSPRPTSTLWTLSSSRRTASCPTRKCSTRIPPNCTTTSESCSKTSKAAHSQFRRSKTISSEFLYSK